MATRKAKPNGQYHLKPDEVVEFMKEQSVKDIPGKIYLNIWMVVFKCKCLYDFKKEIVFTLFSILYLVFEMQLQPRKELCVFQYLPLSLHLNVSQYIHPILG